MSRPPNPELIDKIQNVVFELVKQKSVDAITLRMVAKRLNITATTIYYYYKDKDELIDKIKLQGFVEMEQFIAKSIKPKESAKNKIKASVNAYYKWCMDNIYLAQLIFETLPPEAKPDAKNQFFKGFNVLIELVKEGVDKGEFKSLEVEQSALALYASVYGTITLHLNKRLTDKFNKNADALIKKIIDTYLTQWEK